MPLSRLTQITGAALLLAVAALLLSGCGTSTQEMSRNSETEPSTFNRITGQVHDQEAGDFAISRADCGALDDWVRRGHGEPLRISSESSPPQSRCQIVGTGLHISVYLDAAYAARQRYYNRMVEQAQFGAPDPAKLPHAVAGVGDPSPGEHNASWLPAYNTLFAVRGNRWLTVAYSVAGVPGGRLRSEAARLARLAFRLTAQ